MVKQKQEKKIQQDVYNEDGYTLARPGSHEDNEVPDTRTKKDESNETKKSSNKKIMVICVGFVVSCLIIGEIVGISIFKRYI